MAGDRIDLHPEVEKMIASYFASGNAVPIMSRPMSRDALEGIVLRAVEKEREECAKIADDMDYGMGEGPSRARSIAVAIRCRGKP